MSFAAVRQFRYPAAFRIKAHALSRPDLAAALALRTSAPTQHEPEASVPSSSGVDMPQADHRLLAVLCTGVWSLRRRMLDPGSGKALPEYRRAYASVREMWNEITDRGIEVRDHTGEAYDPGLPMSVRTIQPIPELESEQVIETVRPTIHLGDECIQVGEVVVGAPELEQHRAKTNRQTNTEL